MKDNIDAFNMVLRQNFSLDSIQFFMNARIFSALQTVLILAQNDSAIPYVQAMIDAGACLEFDRIRWDSPVELISKKISEESPLTKKIKTRTQKNLNNDINPDASRTPTLEESIAKYSAIDNALGLAITTYKDEKAELIRLLAERSSVLQLVEASANLLNVQSINNRFIPASAISSTPKLFLNQQECDAQSNIELQVLHTTPRPKTKPTFLFYLCNQDISPTRYAITHKLLDRFIQECTALTDEQRHSLFLRLIARGDQHRGHQSFHWASNTYFAAQLVYTLLSNPNYMDHQNMASLFVAKAVMANKMEQPLLEAGEDHNAASFIWYLQPNMTPLDFANLQKTPSYKAIGKKTIIQLDQMRRADADAATDSLPTSVDDTFVGMRTRTPTSIADFSLLKTKARRNQKASLSVDDSVHQHLSSKKTSYTLPPLVAERHGKKKSDKTKDAAHHHGHFVKSIY